MTGFSNTRQTKMNSIATPITDKKSIIGIKPYLGGKKYDPKSPNRALGANIFNSVQNMEDQNQNFNTEREQIIEEIGVQEETLERYKKQETVDPSDTQTSEFY